MLDAAKYVDFDGARTRGDPLQNKHSVTVVL